MIAFNKCKKKKKAAGKINTYSSKFHKTRKQGEIPQFDEVCCINQDLDERKSKQVIF